MIQILKLEIIIKFCHYAKNLAAFAIAFDSLYTTTEEEIKRIFKIVSTYDLKVRVLK